MSKSGENIAVPRVFHSSSKTLGLDPAEQACLVDAMRTTTDELRFSDATPELSRLRMLSSKAGAKTMDITSVSLDLNLPNKIGEQGAIHIASRDSINTATYVYEPDYNVWKVIRPYARAKQGRLDNAGIAAMLSESLEDGNVFDDFMDKTDVSAHDITDTLTNYLRSLRAGLKTRELYQLSTRKHRRFNYHVNTDDPTHRLTITDGFDAALDYSETNFKRRYKLALGAVYQVGLIDPKEITKRYEYAFGVDKIDKDNTEKVSLGTGAVTIGSFDQINERELAAMARIDQFGYPSIDALYVGLNALRRKHQLGDFRAPLVA